MGYREDLVIDKFSLDIEWQNQPVKFAEWSEKAVEASFERDKAKEQLEIARAQIDSKIRTTSTEKLTETAISSRISLDKDYQAANNKYMEANKNLGILNVARDAFEHRKKALEKMTDLFISNYWADRPMKKEVSEYMNKTNSEEARKSLQETMSTRRRKVGDSDK